ncbi:MAG: beta-galactosidase [Bacillota bacterium]|nr:MAG: beta-galactosidase [Bacillota bacterium]
MKNKVEYPDPIRIREHTVLLTDDWFFSFEGKNWRPINVPFCPESELSGIGYRDFIPVCRYKKTVSLSRVKDRRAMLHFGAVDYRAAVFVNGIYAGSHTGGYTPFAFDITDFIAEGENRIEVAVYDGETGVAASGKQSRKRESYGCFYTRVTGIWQPVWLEYVPENRIENVFFTPLENAVEARLRVNGRGRYRMEVTFDGAPVGVAEGEIAYERRVVIPLSETHLWSVRKGNLYDVRILYGDDELFSYFGLRTVRYEGEKFLLNGEPLFQRLVLDQGYYPDGVYTPKDLAAMRRDIALSQELGFNGARLHEKVFDPRFLYLCDEAGYMVWGEFAGWGVDYSDLGNAGQVLAEWAETLERDFNHPSIVTWCPLNEVWGGLNDAEKRRDVRFVDTVYEFTKKFDCTRPCVDASGGHHGSATDLFDFHCYEDYPALKTYLDALRRDSVLNVGLLYGADGAKYRKGQPVNISECGGWGFFPMAHLQYNSSVNEHEMKCRDDWGYGCGESDGDAFALRYKNLVELISSYPQISGFCYTQLYDVEQEQNGFYRFDRSDKLNENQKRIIRAANALTAAVEK